MKLYKCTDTGLILEEINNYNNGLELSFCAIKGLIPKEDEEEEGLNEKHVPQFERDGNDLKVVVGSIPHPMTEDHFIEYVTVETNKGSYRKNLDKIPTATFKLDDDEKVLNVYSYCNIHGLWRNKGKEESKMNKRYRCDICGNEIEMVKDTGVIPHCCGQEMSEIKEDK